MSRYGGAIFPQHARLLEESAISVEVAKARGYVSVDVKQRLADIGIFRDGRRVPGLLIPVRGTDGRVKTYQYRPDEPRVDRRGRAVKYETPTGTRMAIDVPPMIREQLRDPSVPLWITEGVRKADSAVTAGLCCIALLGVWNWRGTNERGGKTSLPEWEDIALNGREVYIVYDSDVMTKRTVKAALGRVASWLEYREADVYLVYLPEGDGGAKVGLDDFLASGGTADELQEYAEKYVPPDNDKRSKPTQADTLLNIATERYTLGHTPSGDPFAVAKDGPYIARMLRGGQHSLRAELAGAFHATTGRAASNSALADVMLAVEGQAMTGPAIEVHLRTAPDGEGGILVDLGHEDGAAVHIAPGGWEIVHPRSGPLFRRTEVTGPLPIPERGGDVEVLRGLVNVADEHWPLLLGWLVAAYVPDIPHPVALLVGEQGTAKTTTGKMLIGLVDPSAAPLRAMPRDEESWGVAAAASWVVGIDNVSTISPWLSDAMCRAVTGEALISRRLYTNTELSVLHFRRVLLLTSIDTGSLRGDLADRMLTIELHPIPDHQRRTDRQVAQDYQAARPKVLGALFDLTAEMLAALPRARESLTERPRMADFAEILAALDLVNGTNALKTYLADRDQVAADLIDDDPVASAVRDIVREKGGWKGEIATLFELVEGKAPATKPRWWPKTPGTFSGYLNRAAPALRKIGIEVERKRVNGRRVVELVIKGDAPRPESVTLDPESVTLEGESVTQTVTRTAGPQPAKMREMSGSGDEGDALVPLSSVGVKKASRKRAGTHSRRASDREEAEKSVTLVTRPIRSGEIGPCAKCQKPFRRYGDGVRSSCCPECREGSA